MSEEITTSENQRNILIGVDGSKHSKRAFSFYLDRLSKNGDHVIIFNAQQPPTLPAHFTLGFPYAEEIQDVVTQSNERARTLLRECGAILKNKGNLKYKLIKEGGQPGELICRNAKDEQASLIVVGARGLGTIRRTFLGSVSSYVAHHTHIPVCVVPPDDR